MRMRATAALCACLLACVSPCIERVVWLVPGPYLLHWLPTLPQMVRNLRSRPEVAARGRERTHLLLLYSALCGCITCKEPRVREMARDVLLLAGAELGVGVPLPALPSRQPSRQPSLGSTAGSASAAGGGRLSSVDESTSTA